MSLKPVATGNSPMASVKCIVVTPEETAIEETASFVVVPLFDGEIGIRPNHSPMIGRLGYGELRLRTDGNVARYYIDGGFVQVSNNVVSVLTGRLVEADQLDAAKVTKQLAEARKKPSNSDELLELRDKAVMQARAQLRMAKRAK